MAGDEAGIGDEEKSGGDDDNHCYDEGAEVKSRRRLRRRVVVVEEGSWGPMGWLRRRYHIREWLLIPNEFNSIEKRESEYCAIGWVGFNANCNIASLHSLLRLLFPLPPPKLPRHLSSISFSLFISTHLCFIHLASS